MHGRFEYHSAAAASDVGPKMASNITPLQPPAMWVPSFQHHSAAAASNVAPTHGSQCGFQYGLVIMEKYPIGTSQGYHGISMRYPLLNL